jgi:ketosteroid isomerase-like protein
MTDSELRALCHRLLDSIERSDIDAVAAVYDPELVFWFNVTGKTISRDESLAALRDGAALHRRRTYDSRVIDTFASGFMVRYALNIVGLDGRRASLWACLVAQCRDGRIVRMDEYLDSGKFGRRARRSGEPSAERTA